MRAERDRHGPTTDAEARVVCLLIGTEWEGQAQAAFQRVLRKLRASVSATVRVVRRPVLDEVAILREVAKTASWRPDLLILAALHGGSARAIVLAARKSGLPVTIWCHDQRHSLSSSALAAESLRQLGHPLCLVHGSTARVVTELGVAIRAGLAVRRLKEARIGQLGPLHYNLIGTEVNPLTVNTRFGSWIVPLSVAGIAERMTCIASQRVDGFLETLRQRYRVEVEGQRLERAARFHLALADVAEQECLDAIAVDCWNELLPGLDLNPCLGFAEPSYLIACERDLILALTLIAGRALCDGEGYVGDLYAFDELSGQAVLMHCAACVALHSSATPMAIVEQLPPGAVTHRQRVIACHPQLPEGEATLVLLHGMQLDRMHMRACNILETEFESQMQVKVHIEGDPRTFRSGASGNHYIVFPGTHVSAWAQWAQWSGIQIEGA